MLEVIVIDDHSDDASTLDLLGRLDGSRRVRVVKNPGRRGPAAARNVGIQVAQGDWIAFLDSDDVWLPGSLACRAELAVSEPQCQWIGGDYVKWSGEKDQPYSQDGRLWNNPVAGPILRRAADGNRVRLQRPVEGCIATSLTWTSTTMVKRELLLQTGGFDETLIKNEDGYLWVRLALSTDLWFVPKVLALYRQHEKSLTGPPDFLDPWRIKACKMLLADPEFQPYRRVLRHRIAQVYRRQGRYFRARRQFSRALLAHVHCLRFTLLEKKGWRGLAASLLRIS